MKKSVLTIALAAAVVASLAACSPTPSAAGGDSSSGSTAPGPAALKDAKGTTEITIWHGLGAANGVAFQNLIDDFNTTNNDNIHVTAAYQGVYTDLLAKYTASLRSKSAPTIMLAGDVATGYMTDVKQSIPAAEMAKSNPDDLKIGDLSAAGTNYYKVNGVQQAVPMNMSTPVLWVNRDLVRRAGISDSTDLSTLDAVIAAAKTVKEKTGQYGYTMQDDDWTIENYTSTAGQNFCTPANGRKGKPATGITINTGGAKAALTKIIDLYTSGVAVDGAADGSAAINAFEAGKVAFMPYGSGVLGVLKKATPFNYQALPFPISGAKDTSGTTIGGSALWLSSTATKAQQVAGWKLETYLTSTHAQEGFSQATGYVPVNNNTLDLPEEKAFIAANPNFQVFTSQIKSSPVETQTSNCVSGAMTAIRSGIINQLQSAFAGQVSAGAALDNATASAKDAIKQYQDQLGN